MIKTTGVANQKANDALRSLNIQGAFSYPPKFSHLLPVDLTIRLSYNRIMKCELMFA